MENPYQSPQSLSGSVGDRFKRKRTLAVVFGIVLLNVAVNAYSVVQNWPELTWLHYLIGSLLWLGLPIFAAVLLWRGRMLGRWILLGLFGLRGIGELLWVATIVLQLSFFDVVEVFGMEVFRMDVARALFYLAATAWFTFSPSVRRLRCGG